ncbi:MAG: thioredoxin family protein [Phycisphaeraceae bacterium]
MGKPLLIVFLCNHCPFVKHIAPALSQFALEYQQRGLAVLGIMSNDFSQYPDDAPDKMKREADRLHYTFPYLYDETQKVAHAYAAACTPDFFLFDKDHKLVYRGQFDETRPGRISSGNYDFTSTPATGKDLRADDDAFLASQPVRYWLMLSRACPSLSVTAESDFGANGSRWGYHTVRRTPSTGTPVVACSTVMSTGTY